MDFSVPSFDNYHVTSEDSLLMTFKTHSKPSKEPQAGLQPKQHKIALPPADIDTKGLSFKQFLETKSWFEKTFRKTFDFKRPKPLKIGIYSELFLLNHFSKRQLSKCLSVYAHTNKYLEAIIQEKLQYELNAEKIGEVT